MTPQRSKAVNGHQIEEFYWAGDWVVYVDNRASDLGFDAAVSAASVGRNAKRHDPEEGRGPQDEHAVGAAETPNSPSDHPGERA